MDPYSTSVVYHTNQNLIVEDDKYPRMTKEEVIKTFKHFVREHQYGTIYTYR
jgi:hypothetical protein